MARLFALGFFLTAVVAQASAPPRRLAAAQLRVAAAPAAAAPAGAPGATKGTPALAGKMPLKAAEQGFEGAKVKHKDGKTAAADWGDEYGNEVPEDKPHSAGSRLESSFLGAALALVSAVAACRAM